MKFSCSTSRYPHPRPFSAARKRSPQGNGAAEALQWTAYAVPFPWHDASAVRGEGSRHLPNLSHVFVAAGILRPVTIKLASRFCLFLLALLPLDALPQHGPPQPLTTLPASVATGLKSANIPTSSVAVQVQELGSALPHLAVNVAKPMNPASTMKLVTTFAAMELLGPTYTWKTEVWADGPITNGILDGSLIIRGRGDPKLN